MALTLTVLQTPPSDKKYQKLGLKPQVFIAPSNFAQLCSLASKDQTKPEVQKSGVYTQIKGIAFSVKSNEIIPEGSVYFNKANRQTASVPWNSEVILNPIPDDDIVVLKGVTLEIGYFRTDEPKKRTLDCDIAAEVMKKKFIQQFMTRGQVFYLVLAIPDKVPMRVTVRDVDPLSAEIIGAKGTGSASGNVTRGILRPETELKFVKCPQHQLVLENTNQNYASEMFSLQDLSFSSMGIGGLDGQFAQIFRRAFASRLFPPDYMKKLNLPHVKGILMHGPPGCGKTLIARQLSKALKAREPKIINGPEIFDRYVGASEEKIRELFADAEKEYAEAGDASQLHVIIFDEIDAICKKRGSASGGTGVNDSVVNQLLSKIDGVDSLNNILVIGMTNRPDMIDSAITRPGRLEVKIEIGLPDEHGRVQILNIHTAPFRKQEVMGDDVSIEGLAKQTKNFTGAEIAGFCRSAASFALNRLVDPLNPNKRPDTSQMRITAADFNAALGEVKPAFGTEEGDLRRLYDQGIIPYSDAFSTAKSRLSTFARQVSDSQRDGTLVSVLLEGKPGSGKTALMANIALETGFPYVKMISPDQLIQHREAGKVARIVEVFEGAYKTNLAMILIDDVERLLEYANVNSSVKFSNMVLQALLVLLKRRPPSTCRLMVIVTSSASSQMRLLHLDEAFYSIVGLPQLTEPEEFKIILQSAAGGMKPAVLDQICNAINQPLTVKALLNALETTKQESGKDSAAITVPAFLSALALVPMDDEDLDAMP